MKGEKEVYATLPSLVGEKIYLRPLTPQDVADIELWMLQSDPELLSCEPPSFRTPSEAVEAFKNREKSPAWQKFAVVRKEDKMLVGMVGFFNFNPLNRSAEIEILIDPDERRKGLGKEALQVLTRYLFRYRGLNKVYLHTVESNEAAIALLEKLRFSRDGVLRNHFFYDGEFYDGYLYSLLLYELEW